MNSLYLRTVVFGVLDSLVSTVGLLAGIDVAGAPHATVALTGIIYAFVEAFSMAVGNYLSEESVEEYAAQRKIVSKTPLMGGVIMFAVFVLAAFIPIAPYLLFTPSLALAGSISLSIAALLIVGGVSARISKLPVISRAIRMALLGGAAILIGAIVGSLFPAA